MIILLVFLYEHFLLLLLNGRSLIITDLYAIIVAATTAIMLIWNGLKRRWAKNFFLSSHFPRTMIDKVVSQKRAPSINSQGGQTLRYDRRYGISTTVHSSSPHRFDLQAFRWVKSARSFEIVLKVHKRKRKQSLIDTHELHKQFKFLQILETSRWTKTQLDYKYLSLIKSFTFSLFKRLQQEIYKWFSYSFYCISRCKVVQLHRRSFKFTRRSSIKDEERRERLA